VFALRVTPHATIHRAGSDLVTSVSVTLSEALLGFSRVVITHLDGRGLSVTRKPGEVLSTGDTVVVKGEGMPVYKGKGKGDLYINFEVEMPSAEWLQGIDVKALEALLPPKKAELEPRPAVVAEARWEAADMESFADGLEEEDWEDEEGNDMYDDEEDEEDMMHGAPPECVHQ